MAGADDIRKDAYAHVEDLDAATNPTDRVYRNVASKRLIKVRVLRIPNPPGAPSFGMAVFRISGSHVGEDGRALEHGAGHRIAPSHDMTVQTDQPFDLEIMLDLKRREIACATERAVLMEEAAALVPLAS